ncbi:hypothetical protein SNEBB_008997 [Seison nebaliae]|nr:hypothetical protein SNEBB_008997 [Seison nebaliae]
MKKGHKKATREQDQTSGFHKGMLLEMCANAQELELHARLSTNQSLVKYIVANRELEERNVFGFSSVDLLAINGNTEELNFLIKIDKFDITSTTEENYTALHLAVVWNQLACVKILLKAFPSLIEAKTFKNETPLDLAKRYNYTEISDYLNKNQLRKIASDEFAKLQKLFDDRSKKLTKEQRDAAWTTINRLKRWVDELNNDIGTAYEDYDESMNLTTDLIMLLNTIVDEHAGKKRVKGKN